MTPNDKTSIRRIQRRSWMVALISGLLGLVQISAGQLLQTRQRYQIHPGDTLEVHFRLTPEYNQTATVQPDGYIALTISGEVKVATLTVAAAETAIAAGASAHLRDPVVTVVPLTFEKPYFVVAGHVAKPGKYDMLSDTTAMQAMLLCGGPLDTGKVSQILLYRRINEKDAEVRIINLKKVKRTSDLERDITLRSGDMLFVPENTLTRVTDIMRIGNSLGLYVNPLQVVP